MPWPPTSASWRVNGDESVCTDSVAQQTMQRARTLALVSPWEPAVDVVRRALYALHVVRILVRVDGAVRLGPASLAALLAVDLVLDRKPPHCSRA